MLVARVLVYLSLSFQDVRLGYSVGVVSCVGLGKKRLNFGGSKQGWG